MIRRLAELPGLLAKGSRLLGLDVGDKTLGTAISDPGLIVASPIGTIRRKRIDADIAALAAIRRDWPVGALVLGLPVNMDGSEGPRCQSVRQFAANLLERATIFGAEPEIAFWDERLSTVAVTRAMLDADMSRRRRQKLVDTAAAAYILQGALDFLRGAGGSSSIS